MARKIKPPGFEKWTWREIDAGRKMSKGEKRMRRALVSMGAKEKPDGRIEHSSESALFAAVFVIVIVIGLLFAMATA